MQIRVCFFARGRDLAGCAEAVESMPSGSCVNELLEKAAGGFRAQDKKVTRIEVSPFFACNIVYYSTQYTHE